MISLQDSIEIKTSPERIFDWFQHLPEHYLAWHPDHVACRFLKGEAFAERSVLYAEEYIHGKLHRLKFRTTDVVPNRRLEYHVFPVLKGGFIIEPLNGTVRFAATLNFGTRIPVFGWVLDQMFRIFFTRRLDAMRRHMQEESGNLKQLLEAESA